MLEQYLLAVPVFNEEAHLGGVLREARRFADRILVIDDGSTDATPHLLGNEPVSAIDGEVWRTRGHSSTGPGCPRWAAT